MSTLNCSAIYNVSLHSNCTTSAPSEFESEPPEQVALRLLAYASITLRYCCTTFSLSTASKADSLHACDCRCLAYLLCVGCHITFYSSTWTLESLIWHTRLLFQLLCQLSGSSTPTAPAIQSCVRYSSEFSRMLKCKRHVLRAGRNHELVMHRGEVQDNISITGDDHSVVSCMSSTAIWITVRTATYFLLYLCEETR